MYERKQSLPWLVALSMVAGALGQMLVLSAAPHTRPVRTVPPLVARRLASSLRPHSPLSVLFPRESIN